MAMWRYVHVVPQGEHTILPDPDGTLSANIPSSAIAAANKAVTEASEADGKKRGT